MKKFSPQTSHNIVVSGVIVFLSPLIVYFVAYVLSLVLLCDIEGGNAVGDCSLLGSLGPIVGSFLASLLWFPVMILYTFLPGSIIVAIGLLFGPTKAGRSEAVPLASSQSNMENRRNWRRWPWFWIFFLSFSAYFILPVLLSGF